MSSYVIGLDLGKKRDWTALAVLKRTAMSTGRYERAMIDFSMAEGIVWGDVPVTEHRYDLIHLDRWRGRSYRDVVPEVQRVERQLQQAANEEHLQRYRVIPGGGADLDLALVVDQTGVGQAVVDDLRANGLDCIGVTIHGGDAVGRSGRDYRVPKRELVGALQVLLQSQRLGIPDEETIPLAGVLVSEMDNFRATIKLSTGHDSYGAGEEWRAEAHDDLVLAAAMACWFGEDQANQPTAFAIG